jgi:hypothetical protein
MIVDGWGNPMSFYRWPTPAPVAYDLLGDPTNARNRDVDQSCPGGASATYRDPDDPQGKLIAPTWNSFQNAAVVQWFELHCHSVHEGVTPQTWLPRSYYMGPVIVSSGRNGLRGYAQPPSIWLSANSSVVPSPLLPDPMCIDFYLPYPQDSTYHDASSDNILSYSLRQGGKGE